MSPAGRDVIADRLRHLSEYVADLAPYRDVGFEPFRRDRNVVVHDYTRVDPAVVFGVLTRHLDDLVAFGRVIRARYTTSPSDPTRAD